MPGLPRLTAEQRAIVEAPLGARLWLDAPAGYGKTTAAVERTLALLERGVPGNQVLVLLPQRGLAEPYETALSAPLAAAGGSVVTATIGGLARRMLDLFWPLAAPLAGFAHPDQPPVFLTLETAQVYIARLVRPLLDEQGYFSSVVLDRNRLYSQVLDNLNKAALVGFDHREIGARLTAAWQGDPAQAHIYADAQECASLFRRYCLENNLLDFSLQVEIFMRHLWTHPLVRQHLVETYRHLVVDNLEENPPVAIDVLRDWLPVCESALLIFDQDAGYRVFLGADPAQAETLRPLCDVHSQFTRSLVTPPALAALAPALAAALHTGGSPGALTVPLPVLETGLQFEFRRFYPDMLDWVSDQIAGLVAEGLPPSEIAVLSPILSDALRFALMHRLEQRGIPVRSHRPSRALREEPAAQALLTLAAIAHPHWGVRPTSFDFAYALLKSIAGLDLVRAQLLARIVYPSPSKPLVLSPFELIKPEMQDRLTFRLGQRYERLRRWLEDYTVSEPQPLDHFLSRLFGEALSQPGFGFHSDFDSARVTADLIESVQKFRWVIESVPAPAGDSEPVGQQYLRMVQDGVLAAQYLSGWQAYPEEAVYMAPATTFIMQNRPVQVQFWLDAGSRGWYERIEQPLTQPYVLSRSWAPGALWTLADEEQVNRQSLTNLALGLLRRCSWRVYLGLSELDEHGYESRGPLLRAIDRLLRQAS